MKEGITMERKFVRMIAKALVFTLILLGGCTTNTDRDDYVYGNTNSNLANGGLAVADGDWIYFTNYGDFNSLYKIKTDGSGEEKIGGDYAYYLNYYKDWLYYCNASQNSYIYKIKPDGTQRTLVSESAARNLVIVDGWMYFLNIAYLENEDASMTIYKAKTDGSQLTQLLGTTVNGFAVADNMIYYIDATTQNIYKMKTDGSTNTKLSDATAVMMSVFDDHIYYVDPRDEANTLWSMKLDGTGTTKLSDDKVAGFNVSDGWIYYSNTTEEMGGFEFKKMKTDGSEVSVVNDDSPILINVTGTTLVYLSFDISNLISWQVKETIINTDGTNRHDYVPVTMEDVLEGIGIHGMNETVTVNDLEITVTSAYSTNILKNSTPGFEEPLFDDVSDGTNLFVNVTIKNNSTEPKDLTHLFGALDYDDSGSYSVVWLAQADISQLDTQNDVSFHLAKEGYGDSLIIDAGATMAIQLYDDMSQADRNFPVTLAVYENENINQPLAAFSITPDDEYYVVSWSQALTIIGDLFPDGQIDQLGAVPFNLDGDNVAEMYYTFRISGSTMIEDGHYFVARDSGAIYSGDSDVNYPDYEAVPKKLLK